MKKWLAALLALALTVCAGCGGAKKTWDPADELRVTFIDVGKGDCVLLERDGVFALIDAGYRETADAVTACLREWGVETLAFLIITHYDKDHVGGAAAIAENFAISQLYLPGYEGHSKYYTALMQVIEERSLPALRVTEDVSFTLSGVDFTIFASPVEYVWDGTEEGNDNDVSLVTEARYGQDSYLFAGDLEKAGISAYLAAGHGTYDVVKMPHHGSKKNNTDDFIEAVRPKIAVITDSPADPAEDATLTLLKQYSAAVYRTALNGTVTVTSGGVGKYSVDSTTP